MQCTHCKKEVPFKETTLVDKKIHCKPCGKLARRKRAKRQIQARNEAMSSLGLEKVRGALGGVYWE
jgi:DNA-directed RNA polymerase subunit RPC12/RpoP